GPTRHWISKWASGWSRWAWRTMFVTASPVARTMAWIVVRSTWRAWQTDSTKVRASDSTRGLLGTVRVGQEPESVYMRRCSFLRTAGQVGHPGASAGGFPIVLHETAQGQGG